MKMNNVQRQYESTVTGPKIKMGFAADAASHLAELMSNSVYQDKFGSIVREVVSNAVDANAEVSSTQRVQVTLVNKKSLSHAVGEFRVRDFGPGISPDRIENIFTQYFASTKRDTNDQIGGFGIGAKSPFAYSPVFQVITHINGVCRQYLLEKSSSDRTCSLINTGETTESNGTEIVIPISDYDGIHNFLCAMESQLMLMSHQLDITVPEDYEFAESIIYDYGKFLRIVRADRTVEHNGHMVSLGNVLYKIPPINGDSYLTSNYVIKMDIGDVNPTLSREGLELNDNAQDLILSKICSIEDQFKLWCTEQSQSTTDLQKLLSVDSTSLKYPDSLDVVRSGNLHEIKRMPTGWPSQLSVDLMPRILTQVITPSTRYCASKRKWRSASHYMMRKIIVSDKYDEPIVRVRKKVDDRLGTVWKEFLADSFQGSTKNVLVFNVDSNIDDPIVSTCKYSCRDYDEDEKTQIYSEIKASVVACLNDFFQNHTEKYSDYEPTKQWLTQRKERMKQNRKNQSKWTPEMLATRIPLKEVAGNGFKRTELTYSDLKSKHAIILEYSQAKLISWNDRTSYRCPIYAVSSQNFKRCQKAGINCWDEAKVKQLMLRWYAAFHEKEQIRIFYDIAYTNDLTSIMLRRCHFLIPMPTKQVQTANWSPVQFIYSYNKFGIDHKEQDKISILRLNGAVYSHAKIIAQLRNLQKYSEDKPQLRIAINSLFHTHNSDDLYRQAFNSLK